MRLSEFILKNMESILQGWEDFARSIQPADRSMDVVELRDHAKEILEEIAAELASPSSERKFDAYGNTPGEVHADTRAESGFNIDQLMAEFRALRASVLHLWTKREKGATGFEVEDLTRFNAVLDRALAESVARYGETERQAQDLFLAFLGHDLRSPIQAISAGAWYLMRQEEGDPKLNQLGSRMFNSTVRMQKIVDNLLDFIRTRTGARLPIHPESVNLVAVGEQIAEECRAGNPGITIQTTYEGDVTGWWDGVRLGQVYQNLLTNAIQYGAAAPISVATYEEKGEVVLSVHNHGRPIPAAMQKTIFDPMRRYVSIDAQPGDHKNLGLGLYIVREIVTAHHGTIHVTSTESEGTKFTARLPKTAPPTQ